MKTNSERVSTSKRGHANERMKTRLRNGGRIAGMGILYDNYSEESYRPNYDPGKIRVVTPSDFLSKEEKEALNGEVTTYYIKEDKP